MLETIDGIFSSGEVVEWNRVPEVSRQEGAFFCTQLSMLTAQSLMLVQQAAL